MTKTVRILSLALLVACALGALSASAASADEWLLNGSKPAESINAEGLASQAITLIAKGEAETYQCTYVTKRALNAEGRGEVTSVTSKTGAKAIPCEITKKNNVCENEVRLEAERLPWSTGLTTASGALQDKTEGKWKLSCKVRLSETYTNECSVATKAAPYNVYDTTELVKYSIDEVDSPSHSECFEGEIYETTGTELLRSSSGTVGTNPAPAPAWDLKGPALTESAGVEWSGHLTVQTHGAYNITYGCEDQAEGTSGAFGLGAVSKLTFSKCTGELEDAETHEKTTCGEPGTYIKTANEPPWDTALSRSEGTIYDGLSGLELQVKCSVGGLAVAKATCQASTLSAVTSNFDGDVYAEFDKDELLCGKSGELSGTQVILSPLEGSLEVN